MDALIQDIRSGIRQLARQRGSSIVAVFTVAIGIGATTAIFSLIDATMLRPLPYPNPEQLVRVGVERLETDGRTSRPTPSMEDMRTWQASGVFSAVAGWGQAFRGRIADGPEPERIQVMHFTEQYLSMHGVTPILGRDFRREDTEFGAPLVALLSYGYWQSRFSGRPDAIGATVRLDADIATIIGVLPAWFNAAAPLSIPLQIPPSEFSRRGTGRVAVYGRLRPDVTMDQARARLSAAMSEPPRPDGPQREIRATLTSRLDTALSQFGPTINVLAGAVALILLIACVNVAGLLLGRGAARQGEFAMRASLGAGRFRLIRQMLVENLVLALPGGALGVLFAWLSLDAIVANIPLSLPPDSPVALNRSVLMLTALVLVGTALLSGMVPAIRLSRPRNGMALIRGARQVGSPLSRRGGQLLIAAEIALAVILVAGAGLMIRSFLRIAAVDLGFNPDGLVTLEVLPLERNPAAHKTYYDRLLQQVRTLPGVTSASIVDQFTLGGGSTFTSLSAGDKTTGVSIVEATPGYLDTIGARLREGRLPTDRDYESRTRAIVLDALAARVLFPDRPAVGNVVVRAGRDTQPWTVVGVIDTLRHGGPLDTVSQKQPQVFFPLEPTESDLGQPMIVVIRTPQRAALLAEQLREAATSLGPRVMVERIRTADDWFGDRVITPRRRMVLLTVLAALGLALALVGVFAMTAYTVARRTAEIGLRMAFGAQRWQVVGTMVREAAIPTLIGTVLGVGAAMLATRAIASFLFGITPTDSVTLGAVAIMLAVAGSLAALIAASRAAKIDPAMTLRAE